MIPHYTSDDWPDWLIQTAQRWLILAAYSYNHDGVTFASDWIYDATVRELQRHKEKYLEAWGRSPVYPDIFIDDDSWQYTSQHFPANHEVRTWLEEQKVRSTV